MSFAAATNRRPHMVPTTTDERSHPMGQSEPHSFDSIVRTNVQQIRTNLQSIQQNLSNLNRNFISRRIVESLHDKLKQTFEIILQTENTFKAWLQQQQSPDVAQNIDRQRDKFLFGKLFAHFQAEIKKVQELSERVREAALRAAEPSAHEPIIKQSSVILDMENAGVYDGQSEAADNLFFIAEEQRDVTEFDDVTEHEALLSRSVADERYQGIRRIHTQVAQANQIFKDLANLIFSQGEALNSMETHMQDAHSHSKGATMELQKTHHMQSRSRQRRCFMLLFIFALLFCILYAINAFSILAFFSTQSPLPHTRIISAPHAFPPLSAAPESPDALEASDVPVSPAVPSMGFKPMLPTP